MSLDYCVDLESRVLGVRKGTKEAAELVMSEIDRLPRSWRALVHEYGWDAVARCLNEGLDVQEADDALFMRCDRRQRDLLSQNHVTRRTISMMVEAAMRKAS